MSPLRRYAVVWATGEEVSSGRLEVHADRLELHGRGVTATLPYASLIGASLSRRPADRLRGLPVLVLRPGGDAPIRIASLEGPGVLRELAGQLALAGSVVAA
jgi:hypothetical protein